MSHNCFCKYQSTYHCKNDNLCLFKEFYLPELLVQKQKNYCSVEYIINNFIKINIT